MGKLTACRRTNKQEQRHVPDVLLLAGAVRVGYCPGDGRGQWDMHAPRGARGPALRGAACRTASSGGAVGPGTCDREPLRKGGASTEKRR